MAGEIPGRIAHVRFSTGASGTFKSLTKLGLAKDVAVTINRSVIDVTNNDSSNWSESINGTRTWGLTFGSLYVSTDADKTLLRDSILDDDATFRVGVSWSTATTPSSSGGETILIGNARITDAGIAGGTEAAVLQNVTIVGDGALSELN